MDVFARIRESYERHGEVEIFDRALTSWGEEQPVFREFETFADVERLCREALEDRFERRDAVLAALCAASEKDEAAKLALCGLFLPGLIETAQVLGENSCVSMEELHAEILASFWTAVRRLQPDATRVAQRLLNATRWRTCRALGRALRHVARETPVSGLDRVPDPHAAADPSDWDESEQESTGLAGILSRAVAEGVVSDAEADLATATRRGFPAVCERLGLDEMAGRALRIEAKERLRSWVARKQAE